jgi:cytidylate kinase
MSEKDTKLDIVAIDGPSGVGKSTVSRKIAVALGYAYVDTGAMYRAVAYFLDKKSVNLDDDKGLGEALQAFSISLVPAQTDDDDVGIFVNGEDVGKLVRTPRLAMMASAVSKIPAVRFFLTEMQRSYGERGGIVAEGRDVGTVVFPGAAYKFFLDGDPKERAKRRYAQLLSKGELASLEDILQQTLERDDNDRNRPVAPLKMAEDAFFIDTTALSVQEVVATMLEEIERRREKFPPR